MREKLLGLIYKMCTTGPINFQLYLVLNVLSVNVERFMDSMEEKNENIYTLNLFKKNKIDKLFTLKL